MASVFSIVESNDSIIAKLSETELNRYALDKAAAYQSPNMFHQSGPLNPISPSSASPSALI